MILATALLCLSLNIYHEARSEPIEGQFAVAQVTLNRAEGDEKNVCREVLKPRQFSWTSSMVKGKSLLSNGKPLDRQAWMRAQALAKLALSGKVKNSIQDVCFYHHVSKVKPKWSYAMTRVKDIGQHRFYKRTVS